jgi:hypothetical protein
MKSSKAPKSYNEDEDSDDDRIDTRKKTSPVSLHFIFSENRNFRNSYRWTRCSATSTHTLVSIFFHYKNKSRPTQSYKDDDIEDNVPTSKKHRQVSQHFVFYENRNFLILYQCPRHSSTTTDNFVSSIFPLKEIINSRQALQRRRDRR